MATLKPSPYVPAFMKAATAGARPLQLQFSNVQHTNIASTSSFIYDPPNAPLKSTQQLNIDWSQFENHTFFMSAEAKVNLAFEQVINGFPFDGTRSEVEAFFEKMSGFDRYVFDQFPKFHGQLLFSGTQPSETLPTLGTYIVVQDAAGALYPDLASRPTGMTVLNPSSGSSLSIEMQLFIPAQATNGTQVVCQKLSGSTQGFSLYLMPTSSLSSVEARFSVVSGSFSLTVPATLNKGAFNHICATLNRDTGTHYLEFFNQGTSLGVSNSRISFGEFDIDASNFMIGSGTTMTLNSAVVSPTQTLSGSIDEFRLFHEARSVERQQLFAAKAIYAMPNLKLYYRFNEPPPPLADPTDQANSIVIDSSGNALHSLVSNFTGSLRQNAFNDPTSQVIFEKDETVPVIFPGYPGVVALNTDLLSSASSYDLANPNLITRLVPQHYLLEGAVFDGFLDPESDGNIPYAGSGIPGQGQLGSVQLLLSMLYIWARFFDEMKLFVDVFSSLRTVDYDTNTSMPNNFLYDLVRQYGFYLPPLFNDATLEQFIDAENIDPTISTSTNPIKFVQNELMRRILINLPDVLKSKGTQHSIKSFLRAVGIDPENSVRLREFGGPTTQQLAYAREHKRDIAAMVDFTTGSLAVTPFLSASRVEPGYPPIAGTFVHQRPFTLHSNGVSNNRNDGLLTSGSWTVEQVVRYAVPDLKAMTNSTQSLVRMCVTGSATGGLGLMANLLAMSSSTDSKVALYIRPGDNASSPTLYMTMSLPPGAIFDQDKWSVSFGCERNDSIGSRVSSSYFLRVGNQQGGELQYLQATSSFFYELFTTESNSFRTLTGSNASGTFLAIGQNQVVPSGAASTYLHLNNALAVPGEARVLDFTGRTSNLRFWSRALSVDEWTEHVKSYKSLGVEDPSLNYNFVTTQSGSFERVRLDTLAKQDTTRAIGTASLGPLGSITFLDFSLNGFHMTGSGFPVNSDSVLSEIFDFSFISPYFDEATTSEKVRIRSFQDQSLVDQVPWAGFAPVYEIVQSEQPIDDTRFSIEFSLIDALNRDIVTIFSSLDAMDNALGAPELMFSPDYPDLETLRNVYFNRISSRLNFAGFFSFYRWFDASIGTFIQQLIPRKTNFKGTSFVVESHVLERPKFEYQSSGMYLSENDRTSLDDVILLSELDGNVRKY